MSDLAFALNDLGGWCLTQEEYAKAEACYLAAASVVARAPDRFGYRDSAVHTLRMKALETQRSRWQAWLRRPA